MCHRRKQLEIKRKREIYILKIPIDLNLLLPILNLIWSSLDQLTLKVRAEKNAINRINFIFLMIYSFLSERKIWNINWYCWKTSNQLNTMKPCLYFSYLYFLFKSWKDKVNQTNCRRNLINDKTINLKKKCFISWFNL